MSHTIEINSDNSNARGRWRKWLALCSALIAITAIATLPFFVIGEDQAVGCCGGAMPVTHDSWMHFNQMRAFYRGLESGRIYPRWDDATHGGYGAPSLGFYPPGAYYITSIFYFLTRDWSKVWIGFYWLASFGSAAAIYWYARQTMSRAASIVATTAYVFAPYHLINQYQRGAVAEFLSFVWTPLVLLFAERLLITIATVPDKLEILGSQASSCAGGAADISRWWSEAEPPERWIERPRALKGRRTKGSLSPFQGSGLIPMLFRWFRFAPPPANVHRPSGTKSRSNNKALWLNFAGLSASFGAFLWSHPPTAYQFLLVFGPCFGAWAIRRRLWRGLFISGCAFVFGLMIAAAYFYPAFAEQHLINSEDIALSWPYHASYVYDYSQKIYDHIGNPFFARLNRIWAFNAIAILIGSLVALWVGRRKEWKGRALRSRVWLWGIAGIFACFWMTKYSAPIGRLVPKIEIGVFSWRMLTLTSFAAAILAGACVEVCSPAFRRKRLDSQAHSPEGGTTNSLPVALSYATSLLILAGALAMSAWYVAWPMWRGQSFEPNVDHYNYATLPKGAPRETPPMEMAELASGVGRVTVEQWAPESRELRVELEKPDQLQFRTSNFAGWTATVDEAPVDIREGAVRNIVLDLPAGEHRVRLEHRPTPARRAGNLVTLLSLALLFSILITANRFKSA